MKKFKSICEADTRVKVKGTKSNYAVWRFNKNIGSGTFLDRQSTLGLDIFDDDFLNVAKKIFEDNITVYSKTGEKMTVVPQLSEDFDKEIFVSKDSKVKIGFEEFFALSGNKNFYSERDIKKPIQGAATPLMHEIKMKPFYELYWGWLKNLDKELLPIVKESGDWTYSPADLMTTYVAYEIDDAIGKMDKKFRAYDFDKTYEYDPVWLFSKMFWDSDRNDYYMDGVVRKGFSKYFKDSGGYFYLGNLSDAEWAKAINKIFDKRDKIISKWEKSESKLYSDMTKAGLEAATKELIRILKDLGIFGKTFLTIENPEHWKNSKESNYTLFEIKDKSEIEDIVRRIEPEYDAEHEKARERWRNGDDDDISTPSGWAKHFGTAHD